jgi:hypothetical protein
MSYSLSREFYVFFERCKGEVGCPFFKKFEKFTIDLKQEKFSYKLLKH